MMELVSRNVSLKPAHRRQIHSWLKRSQHLGQQVGDFVMKMTIQRTGRSYVVWADVKDHAGAFMCRAKNHELMDACRLVIQKLSVQLHNQRLAKPAA